MKLAMSVHAPAAPLRCKHYSDTGHGHAAVRSISLYRPACVLSCAASLSLVETCAVNAVHGAFEALPSCEFGRSACDEQDVQGYIGFAQSGLFGGNVWPSLHACAVEWLG